MRGLIAFEAHRFRVLLLAMAVLFAAHAFSDRTGPSDYVFGPVGAFVLVATLFALLGHRRVFWTALALAAIPFGFVLHPTLSTGASALAGSGLHAPLFCFTAGFVTVEVLKSERADEDAVVGSICGYLFIALAFGSLYAAVETWHPGSFAFPVGAPTDAFAELVYFSLVTMTTVGYGDVTPVGDAAVSLVTLEAVMGVLYPTFIIARIVSLYRADRGRPFERAHFGVVRRPERFELLLLASLLVILGGPFLDDPGRLPLWRLILTALLLTVFYTVSDRRWSWSLGAALALVSIAGRWWPLGASSVVPIAGLACETTFLFFACASLVGWVAREPLVTRDVLFASVGLYLLLGIAWASAFAFIETFAPGSIVGIAGPAISDAERVYFSFMTLTTNGFGDLVPASEVAKRLATLESFTGVFYPTVLIARLVSLYETA